jgi:hypothetical protein
VANGSSGGLPTEELERLSSWPAAVARSDLAACFTLSLEDLRWLRSHRGEALNDLRRFIFFANRGTVRSSDHEDQTTQAHCHNLVVNPCILSTTGYLQDAIDAQRADGHPVSDEAIANLSPGQFETINPYGTLTFDIPGVLERPRRPTRRP